MWKETERDKTGILRTYSSEVVEGLLFFRPKLTVVVDTNDVTAIELVQEGPNTTFYERHEFLRPDPVFGRKSASHCGDRYAVISKDGYEASENWVPSGFRQRFKVDIVEFGKRYPTLRRSLEACLDTIEEIRAERLGDAGRQHRIARMINAA